MSMLKNNIQYEDNYLYFTFKSQHSSEYNLMIQNNFEDLIVNASRGTSIEYVSPKYQKGSYLLGVTHSQREFPLKLIAYGLNKKDIRKMLKWLETGTIGSLSFDYSIDWEYNVIVSEISDPKLYETDEEDIFITEFEIKFKTLEQTIARKKIDEVWSSDEESDYSVSTNSYGIPEINISGGNNKIVKVMFIGNERADVDINTKGINEGNKLKFSIIMNDIVGSAAGIQTQYKLSDDITNLTMEYRSDSNLFLIDGLLPEQQILNGVLDEANTKVIYPSHFINMVSPGEPILINSFTKQEIENLISTPHNWFVCFVENENSNSSIYYVPSTFDTTNEKSYIMQYDTDYSSTIDLSQHLYELITNDYKNYNAYFGYYKTLNINTNCQNLTVTVHQYTYTI